MNHLIRILTKKRTSLNRLDCLNVKIMLII